MFWLLSRVHAHTSVIDQDFLCLIYHLLPKSEDSRVLYAEERADAARIYSSAYVRRKRTFWLEWKRYQLGCKAEVYGPCLIQHSKIDWISLTSNHHGWMHTLVHGSIPKLQDISLCYTWHFCSEDNRNSLRVTDKLSPRRHSHCATCEM